jgi:hypothetical protein
MWVSKWTRNRNTGMKSINMVAEPKSVDVWPETVELEANEIELNADFEYSDFSLTARSFLRFAGCKVLCERTFPFLLQHDREDDEVKKVALAYSLWHRHPFQPNIKISGTQPFPTSENFQATASADVDAELLTRLFNPKGFPRV